MILWQERRAYLRCGFLGGVRVAGRFALSTSRIRNACTSSVLILEE